MMYRVNALKHENEYREMTEKIVEYYTKIGVDYWTIQSVWSWGYRKTKEVYNNLFK